MLHRRHLSGVGVDGIVGECSASANRRGLDAGGPQGGIGSLDGLRDLDGTHPTAFEWIFPVQTWWLVVELCTALAGPPGPPGGRAAPQFAGLGGGLQVAQSLGGVFAARVAGDHGAAGAIRPSALPNDSGDGCAGAHHAARHADAARMPRVGVT